MVEPRRQLRLAQEAVARDVIVAASLVQHLHHHIAFEQRLLAAIHHSVPTLREPFAKNELAQDAV